MLGSVWFYSILKKSLEIQRTHRPRLKTYFSYAEWTIHSHWICHQIIARSVDNYSSFLKVLWNTGRSKEQGAFFGTFLLWAIHGSNSPGAAVTSRALDSSATPHRSSGLVRTTVYESEPRRMYITIESNEISLVRSSDQKFLPLVLWGAINLLSHGLCTKTEIRQSPNERCPIRRLLWVRSYGELWIRFSWHSPRESMIQSVSENMYVRPKVRNSAYKEASSEQTLVQKDE